MCRHNGHRANYRGTNVHEKHNQITNNNNNNNTVEIQWSQRRN
jgi:hypothetical protein